MKKMWGTRVLAMLLVLALTAGLVPAALAANSEAAVAFKQVPNRYAYPPGCGGGRN